jgi:hypothetical protein
MNQKIAPLNFKTKISNTGVKTELINLDTDSILTINNENSSSLIHNLIDARNHNVQKFLVDADGNVFISGALNVSGAVDNPTVTALSASVAADINNLTQSLNTKLDFTGSVGGITFYNSATPRFGVTGTISTGGTAAFTCSLITGKYYEWQSRAIIRTATGITSYTKDLTGFIDYNNATIDGVISSEGFAINPTSGTMSSSIGPANSLVIALTSASGTNYQYAITVNISSFSF